jgi:hypothetical protein
MDSMKMDERLENFAAMIDGIVTGRARQIAISISKHRGAFSAAGRLGSGADVDERLLLAVTAYNDALKDAYKEALTFSSTEGIRIDTVLAKVRPPLRSLAMHIAGAAQGDLLSSGTRYSLTPALRARLEALNSILVATLATSEANAIDGYSDLQRVSPLPFWRKAASMVQDNPWLILTLVVTALLSGGVGWLVATLSSK